MKKILKVYVRLQIGFKKVLKNSLSTKVRHMADIIKNETKLKMHSRCFGMAGHGNLAFNLVVKLSVFLSLRL
jgi:hypothetical protein